MLIRINWGAAKMVARSGRKRQAETNDADGPGVSRASTSRAEKNREENLFGFLSIKFEQDLVYFLYFFHILQTKLI